MAGFRFCAVLALSLTLAAGAALAADPPAQPPELYDRPVLVVDPGMHTAQIRGADADAEGRFAVTGSDDKTVRVWSLADGTLLRTIRLPAGPGNVGKVYAVAISPDGALLAAGGWTRGVLDREQIYWFDRQTGEMVRPPTGDLHDVVASLTFSKDGSRLAVVLYGGVGVRVYAKETGWEEIARDEHYGEHSLGAAFAADGRLATTALDGRIRLYAATLNGKVKPLAMIEAPEGQMPLGIAFSPDGSRLAVGYNDETAVSLLDGHTLSRLPGPDLSNKRIGVLGKVAWSRDGRTLFAAGSYGVADHRALILAWNNGPSAARRELPAGRQTVMSLVPLPGGDLLAAAADPWLARLRPEGKASWAREPLQADFRNQRDKFSVSSDGLTIDFGFQPAGEQPARFDLATRALRLDPVADNRTAPARIAGLSIENWRQNTRPTLNGQPLPLEPYETSRSLAIHPAGDRFVLGTEWYLRAFDAAGKPLWQHTAPGVVWAVNITGDGRLVVAAYADGTIRWHRMDNGTELLAFMPMPDQINWVAWTPEGFYAASAGARSILNWQVNNGWNAPAETVPIEDIPDSNIPAILPLVLQELETPRALGLVRLAEHNRLVALRTHSHLPPGARLHLLTIGISAYNEEYARNLRLHYADRDAQDLASAITGTQGSLYAEVEPQVLTEKKASKAGILRALETMNDNMQRSTGNDLAVVHFSGHGALIGDSLYLLPYDADPTDAVSIKTSGLSAEEFKKELMQIAQHGRVLLLLDACHSGAAMGNGSALTVNATALGKILSDANITVLTSSTGQQDSREDAKWGGHGAFTKALIDAFSDPAADLDQNGLITVTGLTHYLETRVPSLTDNQQTPRVELRYDGTIFARGM